MHLKPINRQGKKRRKLNSIPALSCGYNGFQYRNVETDDVAKIVEAQVNTKKDKAAA